MGKGYKGKKHLPRAGEEEELEKEREWLERQRARGGQSSTVGMMPPSDSEESEDEDPKQKQRGKGGQNPNVGLLPPSSSEDEDESGEEGSDSDEDDKKPRAPRLAVPDEPRRKKKDDDEPDPEQIRKDVERLALIKQKREEQRLARIKAEGWDRFAPESDTNRKPGSVPKDHPDKE